MDKSEDSKGLDIPSAHLSNPSAIPLILNLQGYAFPILNILVPQTGHTPWVAGFPFFMVMALAYFISLLVRHFTQYACISYTSFTVWRIENIINDPNKLRPLIEDSIDSLRRREEEL